MTIAQTAVTPITVKSIRRVKLDSPVPVYDATSPAYHNFMLHNRVVVHNTAKKARDSAFQEVLRLQGKPPNAIRTPMTKLVANKVIQNMLAAIGYDHREKDPYAKLRVNLILLLADADPDGKHINVLVLTTLYKLLPKLFEMGRVVICNAPLYSAYYKGKRYFGSNFQECYSQMPKGSPKDIVSRAKGWGELEPEVLDIIAFHPETRNTIVVKPLLKADHAYFNLIMGSDTAARKQLLGL